MAPSTAKPKVMSSRLANMKFMSRGAPQSPSTPAQPPAKKQRLSNGSVLATPETPADQYSQATRGVETEWHFSFKAPQIAKTETPLRIVSAGFSSIDGATAAYDNDDDDEDDEDEDDEDEDDGTPEGEATRTRAQITATGRKSFNKFNKKLEKQQNPQYSSSSQSDSASDSEDEDEDGGVADEDDPTGVKALLAAGQKEATERARAERKAKKKAENAESALLAEQRRKKEVNLNNITSISGGGGAASSTFKGNCHHCGQYGHSRNECPVKKNNSRLRRP